MTKHDDNQSCATKPQHLLCGIDEAGYGPTLGPLVISATAFHVPDTQADLWSILNTSITKTAAKRDHRLRIYDSKLLYKRKEGLKWLERTALVIMQTFDVPTQSLRAILNYLSPETLIEMQRYPWYQEFDLNLPLENTPEQIALQANAVKHDLNINNIAPASLHIKPTLAGQFNRIVDQTRNKSRMSLGLILQIVHNIGRTFPNHPARFCIDRQGGRAHYRDAIVLSLDLHDLNIVSESETISTYQCDSTGQSTTFEFVTNGESHHLPIAVAGIISKYIRELLMMGLNQYWSQRVPSLKPTAGYYTDAQRFLADIESARSANPIDANLLIRQR